MADVVLGFEQITGLSAVKSLTVPAGSRKALVQSESQNVRMRSDGTDPEATVGMLIITGAHQPTQIDLIELSVARFIEAAGSAKLNVTYYGSDV